MAPPVSVPTTGFSLPSGPTTPFIGPDAVQMDLATIAPPLAQQWGVYDLVGNPVFSTVGFSNSQGNIDSFVSLNYDNNAKVSTFPVEQGSFASYNKTGTPYSPKIGVIVSGQTRITALMELLEVELNTINLYQIITPERTYQSVTLDKYSYARTQKAGKNLLHVTMTFMQVIEVIPNQYAKTAVVSHPKKPTATDKHGDGKVQTDPTLPWKNKVNANRVRLGLSPKYDSTTGAKLPSPNGAP